MGAMRRKMAAANPAQHTKRRRLAHVWRRVVHCWKVLITFCIVVRMGPSISRREAVVAAGSWHCPSVAGKVGRLGTRGGVAGICAPAALSNVCLPASNSLQHHLKQLPPPVAACNQAPLSLRSHFQSAPPCHGLRSPSPKPLPAASTHLACAHPRLLLWLRLGLVA